MKVETKFHPVTITLETPQEFDFMFDALEQALQTYEKNSLVRNFIIDTINTMGEVHNHQPSVEEINDMLNTAVEDEAAHKRMHQLFDDVCTEEKTI